MNTLHTLPSGAAPLAARALSMLQGVAAAWRRQRLFRATWTTLSSLDDRTLRDLGFDRHEIGSVASEMTGAVESSRIRSPFASGLHA